MATLTHKHWQEPQPVNLPQDYQDVVGGSTLLAQILYQRGYTQSNQALTFLDPDLFQPASPFDLDGMDLAVARITQAIQKKERICVWGDFDVDGQTATTLLVSILKLIGAEVTYHIPVRQSESHGINLPKLVEVIEAGTNLLITCDTGISDQAAIEYAQAQGVDVIISDHHDLPVQLPPAKAIINPKLGAAEHPLATLPGVGVAYKLAEALLLPVGKVAECEANLDLVALGIVADLALQRGDVRYLLQRGLRTLRTSSRPGLRAILELAEINQAGITEEHIGFELGPRLNALGRLSDANLAVDLLLTQDKGRALILANQLEGLNIERRLLTEQVYQGALAQIERDPTLLDHAVLLLGHPAWPGGVIGIVASRLVEQYQRPVALISSPLGQLGRGSARSVPGINITAALAENQELLEAFGGHPMAAGFGIQPEQIDQLRLALSHSVQAMQDELTVEQVLRIDGKLPLEELSLDLIADLERLSPFGPGNPPLTLLTQNLTLTGLATFGRNSDHLQLTVEEYGQLFRVVWWQGANWTLPEWLVNGVRFDLAYEARASNYRGQPEIQIEWLDGKAVEETLILTKAQRELSVMDFRQEDLPLEHLQEWSAKGDCVVWAEGDGQKRLTERGISSRARSALAPTSILAVWTAPPSPEDFQAAVLAVKPEMILVFGIDPEPDNLEGFLQQLVGYLKFSMKNLGSQVSITRLAEACAQREATISTALRWMESKGSLQLDWLGEGGEVSIQVVKNAPKADLPQQTKLLRELWKESQAYRLYFKRAEADKLLQVVN